MIAIHCKKHAAHIGLVAKLLKIQHILISTNSDIDLPEYKAGYDYALNKLNEWTNEYQEYVFWEWYLKNRINVVSVAGAVGAVEAVEAVEAVGAVSADVTTIHVTDGATIDMTITNFLEQLNNIGVFVDFHKYLKNSVSNRKIIKDLIKLVLNKTAEPCEIEFWNEHTGRNLAKKIDFFSFLMILYFGKEGKALGLHTHYVNIFKQQKYSIKHENPSVAVLLSGYSRDYLLNVHSFKKMLDNIYVDVFIHTWSKKEPRTSEIADIESLKTNFKPIKIQIEDLGDKKKEFSLLDKQSMLFFSMNQQKDDASFYVNADLYSILKASLLVEEFEKTQKYTYGCILKMPFCYALNKFDYFAIAKNIKEGDNVLWVGGTGCKRCTMEYKWPYLCKTLKHNEHVNDIDVSWFYGNKKVMQKACQLYMHSFAIAESVLEENIQNYVNLAKHRKFNDFVYIFGIDYVARKVYSINDLSMRVHAFYPQNMYRMYMNDVFCVSTNSIDGVFSRFYIERNLIF